MPFALPLTAVTCSFPTFTFTSGFGSGFGLIFVGRGLVKANGIAGTTRSLVGRLRVALLCPGGAAVLSGGMLLGSVVQLAFGLDDSGYTGCRFCIRIGDGACQLCVSSRWVEYSLTLLERRVR